jgi:hypothetical protein
VQNLSGLLLNAGVADIAPPLFGAVRSGTITVS